MILNIPNGHAEVAFHHLGGNVTGEMVNTLGFDWNTFPGAPGQASLDAVMALWRDGPHSGHTALITFQKATCTYRSTSGTLEVFESLGGGGGGSQGNPPMPLNVTSIIEKRTARAGRKYRGRILFGGFPAAATAAGNPNELDPGFVTSVQATWDAFYTACVSSSMLPVLLHPTGGPDPTPLTGFIVKALVGNMRKRIR